MVTTMMLQAVIYSREVQARFGSKNGKFAEFIMLLRGFRKQTIDVATLAERVTGLFDGHDDLILKFNDFMPKNGKEKDSEIDEGRDCEKTLSEGVQNAMDFVKRVKMRLQNGEHVHKAFLQIINRIRDCFPEDECVASEVAALLGGQQDLIDEFNQMIRDSIGSLSGNGESKKSPDRELDENQKTKKQKTETFTETKQEKYQEKPVSELDLSKCQQVSPSYWVLPEDLCTPSVSNISEHEDQVLNSRLVGTNAGNGNSRSRRRIKKEEILAKWEEDRFEMDMSLNHVTSASERVKGLLITIDRNKIQAPINIKDYLTIFDLRCIEHLYGERGLQMVDLLHNNPVPALHVISPRLIQKTEELRVSLLKFDNFCKPY